MPTPLRYLLLLLLTLGSSPSFAQSSGQPPTAAPAATPAQTLDQLGKQLDSVKAALKRPSDDVPFADLRSRVLGAQDQARQLASNLAPHMAALQAQLAVLGPAPANGAPAEAAEVSTQRRQLDKLKANLDAQIKQAQLLNQDAGQLAARITGLRSDQFQARLTSRTPTPFSRSFWADPIRALPDDVSRLHRQGTRWQAAWATAWQPPNRQPLLWCLLAAALLLGGGRWLLEWLLLKLTTRHVTAGHLRRSAMAVAVALSDVLTIGLAAQLVRVGLNWNDILDADLDDLSGRIVHLVMFAAYVTGLGRAFLSVRHPSWRLPPLSDLVAQRLRPFPWLLGAAVLLFGVFDRVTRSIGSSLSTMVTVRGLIALLISTLIGIALLRLRRARQQTPVIDGGAPAQQPLWFALLATAATVGVIVSWFAVASGYIALAYFIAVQMLWIGVVFMTAYLLIQLSHDGFVALLSPKGLSGRRLQATFDLSPNALEQTAVVLSAASRIVLLLLALATVIAPFGAGPQDLLTSATQTFSGLKIGSLPIEPGSIFTALLVFVLGLVALRLLKHWLSEQLLPKSTMEPGMQSSIVTLTGYLGGVLVFVLALAALRVDLKSIAWIVSALSVGIGFGLQSVVQNFISGLILLVERPVKVGDWVSLSGDIEGDIRRINVRATEIQMADRSTVIVPNSQLITQNVRNVTLANALGRVLIKLPMPLDTDAGQARTLLLGVLREFPGTLTTPAPAVLLESLAAGSMSFVCIAYVGSPREVGSVKSALLFAMLERLRDAKLPLTSPQRMLVHTLPPAPDSPAPDRPGTNNPVPNSPRASDSD